VEMVNIGKLLLFVGLVIACLGVALIFSDKIPFLGRLPGDIRIERGNFRFYFPIVTSIALSIFISAILWLISHFRK